MPQPINPWKMAIDNWLAGQQSDTKAHAFCDAWVSLKDLSTADLELNPRKIGERHPWTLLGLKMSSFGRPTGSFSFAVREAEAHEERCIILSAPRFTKGTHQDLVQATLSSLYRLAPTGSELEVVLEDELEATSSTLAIAGTYTDAGWGLNPKRTQLISDDPRLWVFRFTKN